LLNLAQGAGISVTNSLGTTTFVNTGVLSFQGGGDVSPRTGALTPLATDYGRTGITQPSGASNFAITCLVTSVCDFTNFQVIGGPGTGGLLRLLAGSTGQSIILEDFSTGNPKNVLTAGGSTAVVNGWQLFTNVTGSGTYQSWSQTDIVMKSGATTLADFNS